MGWLNRDDRRVWPLIGLIALVALAFIPLSQRLLGIEYSYTVRTVALGGALLGAISGVVGSFAVLRRESLMGDALSHAALPGVGIAFLLAGRELGALLLGAGIASWLGVVFIRLVLRTTRLKQDAALGIVLAGWFGAGIALLTYIQSLPDAGQAGLKTFIFGQAAAIVDRDVELISLIGLIGTAIIVVFWKEFKLVTFDPEFAGANGFRVGLINGLLSTLIVITIVLGLQLAGVVLMVGLLIAPGIAARQWTHRLDQMIILAAIFGAFAGGTGAVLSAVDADVPTGPMIIVTASVIVALSMMLAPGRGLIGVLLRQRAERRRLAAYTTLRDLYRYALAHGGPDHPVPAAFIRGIGGPGVRAALDQLARQRLIQPGQGTWILTEAGVAAARRDQHNQRLWDAYREYGDQLALPVIAEDRGRDIREVLPAAGIAALEDRLEEQKI
jgi:manganese/zinc/iron transport system permease protein